MKKFDQKMSLIEVRVKMDKVDVKIDKGGGGGQEA
jgi:hypothetical protein